MKYLLSVLFLLLLGGGLFLTDRNLAELQGREAVRLRTVAAVVLRGYDAFIHGLPEQLCRELDSTLQLTGPQVEKRLRDIRGRLQRLVAELRWLWRQNGIFII